MDIYEFSTIYDSLGMKIKISGSSGFQMRRRGYTDIGRSGLAWLSQSIDIPPVLSSISLVHQLLFTLSQPGRIDHDSQGLDNLPLFAG